MQTYTQPCMLCGKDVDMSGGRYTGKMLKQYQMLACNSCISSNADGWHPLYEDIILEHLKKEGIPAPHRNRSGYLPLGL